ncbi:MAG: penicillin-binding transpeptidase domain-containing protein [Solirubrobacteraceae bacterium]
MPRRSPRYVEHRPRGGSLLQPGGRSGGRNRGGRPGRVRPAGLIGLAVLLAAAVAAVLVLTAGDGGAAARAAAAQGFAAAWKAGDRVAMWRTLTPRARAAYPEATFAADYAGADRAAGVRRVTVGRPAAERGGRIPVVVSVATADFATLGGTVALPVAGSGAGAGVSWDPSLRLPGLRPGESVVRSAGPTPPRAPLLAADGTLLDATGLGASIAGVAGDMPTGLERLYDRRLGGHPSERLLFGRRIVARTAVVRGRSVRTTIRPGLMTAAASALGNRLGGVALLRPADGAVLALAGLAVSAPQPPGSTFKIITLSAALEYGIAQPSTSFPVATYATLSGVQLTNASKEACGGTLTEAFIKSCNSVFAPLGARLGAARLVAAARAFGFDEQPAIPAAKPSTISPPGQLRDDLAVGAAAIGQDRDLATPLEMAASARRSPPAAGVPSRGSRRSIRSSGARRSPPPSPPRSAR